MLRKSRGESELVPRAVVQRRGATSCRVTSTHAARQQLGGGESSVFTWLAFHAQTGQPRHGESSSGHPLVEVLVGLVSHLAHQVLRAQTGKY